MNKANQIKLTESSHLNYDKLTQEKFYLYVVMKSPKIDQFFFSSRYELRIHLEIKISVPTLKLPPVLIRHEFLFLQRTLAESIIRDELNCIDIDILLRQIFFVTNTWFIKQAKLKKEDLDSRYGKTWTVIYVLDFDKYPA